jgi:TonB family protein
MSAIAASYDDLSLKKTVVYSLLLHGLLALAVVASAFFQHSGNAWGGIGGTSGGVKVSLVGPLAGIPMPTPPVVSPSQVVDPTKGLYKEEPKKKLPEPPTNAQKIPQFEKNKPPKPISHPSRVFEDKLPPPDNAVPYGRGGTPNLPTGYSSVPGGPGGPVGVQGQGGGDFAARYSWYVESVKRRIAGNWLQNTIDQRILAARTAHCVVIFSIYRDGTVKDVHIAQTSGNSSMDTSGVRAVLSSNPMPALPGDYSGSYVTVTFDFDLGMNR